MKLENYLEMQRVFGDSEISLCLEPYKLYEGILIIKWPNSNKFNSAAMGIRFIDDYTLVINPYQETDTYEIIKKAIDDKKRIKLTVNFTSDVVKYAKTALTGLKMGDNVEELNENELYKFEDVAFLKDSYITILGETISEFKDFSLDCSEQFKEFKDLANKNINTKFPVRFDIKILNKFRLSRTYQPINRGSNLAIEAITLTSKLPAFIDKDKNLSKHEENKVFKILERIREYQKEIRRFSADKKALKVCNIIDEILSNFF